MTFIAFILGLTIGIGFYAWKQRQFNQQLRQILTSFSDKGNSVDLITSLPMQSLLRREINVLNQRCQGLEEQLQTWQALLEIAPIGYLQVDQENQLLWCNQQARELLNIDRWQAGQVRLLLQLVRSYELDQLIEETRHSQKSQVQQWVFYPTNYGTQELIGDSRTVQLSYEQSLSLKAFSHPLSQGQVGVFLENQQPLVELSQSRDRAFCDLTHELRTPLTSISLVAERLQKSLQNPELRWVEQMLKETQRLINFVQDWLDISQFQQYPHQNLQYESVELRELIFSVWQSLEVLAIPKQITLAYSRSDQIYLQVDKSRFIQVFFNLFDNSIKHSPPQTEIRVEVEFTTENLDPEITVVPCPFIQINIIDYGSGFSESDLPYVFDRLYRGDTSRVRQTSDYQTSESLQSNHGSGLGLFIVKQIVQAHGGSITAKNHPETSGAYLQITLPYKV